MAAPNSYVQVNNATSAGKKLATYEFPEGADLVESEAVTLTDSAGLEVLIATETTVAAIAASAASIDAKTPPPATTSTLTAIQGALVATSFLATDLTRLGFSIYNHSTTDVLYLKLMAAGGPVSVSFFTVALLPGAYYEDPFRYTGPVEGIWGSVGIGVQALVNAYNP